MATGVRPRRHAPENPRPATSRVPIAWKKSGVMILYAGERMASKTKRNGSTELPTTSTQAEAGEVPVGNSARDEETELRAYEIYLERGEQPGRELDDWLQPNANSTAECVGASRRVRKESATSADKARKVTYGYRATPFAADPKGRRRRRRSQMSSDLIAGSHGGIRLHL